MLFVLVLVGAASGSSHECDSLLLWPQPMNCQVAPSGSCADLPSSFEFKLLGNASGNSVLEDAVQRYRDIILGTSRVSNSRGSGGDCPVSISTLEITVSELEPAGAFPTAASNEGYVLDIPSDGPTATISAMQVWGALRGLETFSQLVDRGGQGARIRRTGATVRDSPRFGHRGFLLDTGRHFVSLTVLTALLDAMAYAKLNVLHWHITDDESFPMASDALPLLAEKGAFGPDSAHIYSAKDIASVIELARRRGVRVVPEIDMPGHASSWFKGYPDLATQCPDAPPGEFSVPMDPTRNSTYEFVSKLLAEVADRFPDAMLHIGGDEVQGTCWQNSTSVQAFCQKHNITSPSELQLYFEQRVAGALATLGKTPVIWEENFGLNLGYPAGSVVEVWKGRVGDATVLEEVVRAGHKAIWTTRDWYLDWTYDAKDDFSKEINSDSQWQFYYSVEPFSNSTLTPEEQASVLGGEVCSWNPYFDNTNLIPEAFPRTLAAAERLWSARNTTDLDSAAARIRAMRCRLLLRGIPVAPIAKADFCPVEFTFVYSPPYSTTRP